MASILPSQMSQFIAGRHLNLFTFKTCNAAQRLSCICSNITCIITILNPLPVIFIQEYPDYCAYKTPLFFCDDWLNLYLDKYPMQNDPNTHHQETNEITCSDYRFVYIGTKGLSVMCWTIPCKTKYIITGSWYMQKKDFFRVLISNYICLQVHGLLFTLMFLDLIVGQQMFVVGNSGIS